MKNLITFFLSLAVSLTLNAQKTTINLNFENIENGFPKDWNVFGDGSGIVMISDQVVMEGKSAMYFENQESDGFKALALNLPQTYAGKSIILSGFIKTENVSDGFAGLWMRIDPDIAFENMQSRGITGTTNWKKYEITLKMQPELTDKIVIGALLTGKGKMWVDDFHITVDGKDIHDAKIYQKVLSKAALDKEFDTGSGITKLDLSAENINNLKTLGLIWGWRLESPVGTHESFIGATPEIEGCLGLFLGPEYLRLIGEGEEAFRRRQGGGNSRVIRHENFLFMMRHPHKQCPGEW